MGFLIARSAGSRGRLAASALLASSWLVQSSATALAQDAPPEARDRQESAVDAAPVAPAARERTEYMGRTIAPTMHFSGAGWLTRPTREQEEEPLKLLNSLKIQPGQIDLRLWLRQRVSQPATREASRPDGGRACHRHSA